MSHEQVKNAARLHAIVNSAVDGIISIDVHGHIETFNPAAEKLFGYTAAEVIGRNVSMLMSERDRAHHNGYIRAYLDGGPRRVIGIGREVVGRRKDGTELPLHLSVGEASVGQERTFTGIVRDLSEVRRLEREFLQAQKMEAVGRLASGIAHDFNNLLMGIIGCADIALDRNAARANDESVREPLEALRRAAQRGSAIVSQLLAFSQKSRAQTAIVDVNAIARDVQRMVASLLGADIAFRVRVPPTSTWVRADATQLEQVLMNLLVNARHAMPDGGAIDLDVASSSDRITLQVRDDGCGMDAQTLARVFEPFFTTRQPGDGTGLGLSTAYAIIQRFEGSIEVESAVGVGTCFTIQLPAAPAPDLIVDTPEVTQQPPAAATVLVVEDDTLVRLSVRHYLSKNGFTVQEADSSEHALASVDDASPPALLLTDIVLPDRAGDALARELQTRLPALRVVFMSAHDRRFLTDHKHISADALTLQKPFSEAQLLAIVAEALA